MADFNTSDFGEAGGSPISPKQPVSDTGPAYAVQFAQEIASTVFDMAEQKKAQRANTMLNEFTQESLKIAEGVSQGVLKSTQAKSLMRSLFSKYSAAAPGLTEDLAKRQKDLLTTAGLGKVIEEGTLQEQAQVKVEQEAIQQGWVDASAPEETRERQLKLYFDYQTAQRQLAAAYAEVARQRDQVGLEAAQLSLQNQRAQAQSQRGLAALAGAVTPRFQMDLYKVVDQVNSGQMNAEEAIRQVEMEWNNVQANMAAIGNQAGSEQIGNLSRPMQTMYENTIAHLKGETSLEVLRNNNDKMVALSSKEFLSDPTRTRIVTTSKLLGNNVSLDHLIRADGAVADFIGGMSKADKAPASVVTSDPEDVQTISTWMGILGDNMDAAIQGNLSEEASAELNTNLVNLFKSVDVHGAYSSNPKDYQRVVDFLADPKFGKYAEKNEGIPSEIAIPAADMLAQQYTRQVIPMLREEFEKVMSTVGFERGTVAAYPGQMPAPIRQALPVAVEPVWSGTGITFRAKEGAGDPRNTRAALVNLNKRVAPQLNKMIRMSAHLEGSRDYKKVYEETYQGIFGQENPNARAAEQAQPNTQTQAPRPAPSVGERVGGWEYVGGNPRDKNSWRKVDG